MTSLRQALCPAHLLGRVSAASRLASATSVPAGALLGGLVGQAIGTRLALAVLALGYVLVGGAISVSAAKVRFQYRASGQQRQRRLGLARRTPTPSGVRTGLPMRTSSRCIT